MTNRLLGVKAGRIFAVGLAAAALAGCARDIDVLHDKSAANREDGASGTGGAAVGSKPSGNTNLGGLGAEAKMDLYVMLDQSSSLSDPIPGGGSSWWSGVVEGVLGFLNAPSSIGTGFGLQYFPLNGIAPASCTADYTTPEVEIAPLPGNALAVSTSLEMHAPTSFTPTAPALRGAIAHMKAWGPEHPDRVPAVVLVTDGFPTECDPQDITDIAAIAAEAATTEPVVRTFVVGMNLGLGGANLDELARAGRTGRAILINADVSPSLSGALTRVIENPDGGG